MSKLPRAVPPKPCHLHSRFPTSLILTLNVMIANLNDRLRITTHPDPPEAIVACMAQIELTPHDTGSPFPSLNLFYYLVGWTSIFLM
ncbi:hypothetical protein NLI96_g12707 [Meripilus lineatus]|uniref:Uncharacterized protein n=1 Tax=Meripilus lineatus TaxID=2056292 RepID=A0AAD5UPB9_9APHY|nr:hypothetical protein NLI96_g12707 [Physisporinus lineatus]